MQIHRVPVEPRKAPTLDAARAIEIVKLYGETDE